MRGLAYPISMTVVSLYLTYDAVQTGNAFNAAAWGAAFGGWTSVGLIHLGLWYRRR